MIARSPPKLGDPAIRCGLCNVTESGDTVQCDECMRWFHFTCVGVDATVATVEWKCERCIATVSELEDGAKGGQPSERELELVRLLEVFKLQAQEAQEEKLRAEEEALRYRQASEKQRAQQERRHETEVAELRTRFADLSNRHLMPPINNGVQPKRTTNLLRSSTGIDTDLLSMQGPRRHAPDPPVCNFSFLANEPVPRRDTVNRVDLGRSHQDSLIVTAQLAVTMKRQYMQKLPKFSGVPREWAFFESVYNSTTEEGQFTETENVFRLREALVSPALDLVLDQVMFSTNAAKIMSDLKEAYGRADRLIMELTKEILAIPPLKRSSDPKLRDFGIAVKNFVAKVKSLQREGDLKTEYTLCMLADKLQEAPGLYKEWARKKLANPNEDLESFAAFLMEKVAEMPPGLLPSAESTLRTKLPQTNPVRRHNAHLEVTQSRPKTKATCLKCQGTHQLWKCSSFVNMSVRDRREFVKTNRVCFACLSSTEHRARNCQRNFKCGVPGCGRSHNRLLHEDVYVNLGDPNERPRVQQHRELSSSSDSDSVSGHQLSHREGDETLYKIIPVRLHGPNQKIVSTFALLDDGSAITLMNEEVAKELGLTGTRKTLTLQWTASIVREEDALLTSVGISAEKGGRRYDLDNVYCVQDLDLPSQTVNPIELGERYSHLRRVPIPTMKDAKPMMLIGLDQASFLLGTRNRRGNDDQPTAIKTRLGWTVFGRAAKEPVVTSVFSARKPRMRNLHHSLAGTEERRQDLQALHLMVKEFFTTENFGVSATASGTPNEDEVRAIDIMERTLKFDGQRYEIGLLWRKDDIQLPDSWQMSLNRLRGLERKLAKDPKLLAWMNAHMQSLLDKGYARIASDIELNSNWPADVYCTQ